MSVTSIDPVADADAASLADASVDLTNHDLTRKQLRREMTGAELRMALKDLREGLRGMIRVSPLVSVLTAGLIGAAWARRRSRRSMRR